MTAEEPPTFPPSSLVGRPLAISQERINRYAELSNDFNPLHVDPEFARGTMFGGTIAHGTISLACLLEALARLTGEPWLRGGEVSVKFIAPARPGDVITPQGKPTAETEEGHPGLTSFEASCQNQTGQPIITGTARVPVRRSEGE